MTDGIKIYAALCSRHGVTVMEGGETGGLLIGVGAGLTMATLDLLSLPWRAALDMSGGKSAEAWEAIYRYGEVLRPEWVVVSAWFSISRPERLISALTASPPYAPLAVYVQPKVELPVGIPSADRMEDLPSVLKSQSMSFPLAGTGSS